MLKVDLHIHTSEDKRDVIKYSSFDLIDFASVRKFDVLAITNHNKVLFNDELSDYAAKKGILLIPGTEATVEKKHVVILNCDKEAEKIKTFQALREYRKDHPEILILAPHPFYPKRSCLRKKFSEHADLFDAVEYCHFYTTHFNAFNSKAKEAAEKLGLPLLGTSDAHHLFQLEKTYSMIDAEKNCSSIINAIKNKKIKIVSVPMPFFHCFYAYFRLVYKHAVLKAMKFFKSEVENASQN